MVVDYVSRGDNEKLSNPRKTAHWYNKQYKMTENAGYYQAAGRRKTESGKNPTAEGMMLEKVMATSSADHKSRRQDLRNVDSSPRETLESHGSSEPSSDDGTAHGNSLQCGVGHLAPVATTAALEEVGHVVSTGEGSVRNFLAEELTQRAPAVADLVLEEPLWGNEAADLCDMVLVDLLALVGEVAAEEGVEELV
jgi:hypothetical protein